MDNFRRKSTASHPLTRFSGRVQDYVKYRPSYPEALLEFMVENLGLGPSAQVADIGSGTGIFTRQLLERGAAVFAVEPNAEMRNAADELLRHSPGYKSVHAPAEFTGLAPTSVDMITAAQSFHWFDAKKAKTEWKRILKYGGTVVLIWNDRRAEGSAFLEEYDALLQTYGTDYNEVNHRNTEESGIIDRFFQPRRPQIFCCENEQRFDFEGLKGRLLSSSYAPAPGHPRYLSMIQALREMFDKHQHDGRVRFEYTTKAFYEKL